MVCAGVGRGGAGGSECIACGALAGEVRCFSGELRSCFQTCLSSSKKNLYLLHKLKQPVWKSQSLSLSLSPFLSLCLSPSLSDQAPPEVSTPRRRDKPSTGFVILLFHSKTVHRTARSLQVAVGRWHATLAQAACALLLHAYFLLKNDIMVLEAGAAAFAALAARLDKGFFFGAALFTRPSSSLLSARG